MLSPGQEMQSSALQLCSSSLMSHVHIPLAPSAQCWWGMSTQPCSVHCEQKSAGTDHPVLWVSVQQSNKNWSDWLIGWLNNNIMFGLGCWENEDSIFLPSIATQIWIKINGVTLWSLTVLCLSQPNTFTSHMLATSTHAHYTQICVCTAIKATMWLHHSLNIHDLLLNWLMREGTADKEMCVQNLYWL